MAGNDSPAARISRREYFAGGIAAATAAVAGCTEGSINWIADKFLEEVNIFNETDSEVSGAVTIVGPDGETRLDEEFTLDGADDSDENSSYYGDVWADAGSYDVSMEFDDPVEEKTSASETVSIDDPGDQMLVVVLGAEELDADIAFRVGDDLSDTWPEGEE